MSTDLGRQPERGAVTALVTIGSALLGGAYYAYLVAVPFPPDLVRIVPTIWLIAALAGLAMGIKTLRAGVRRYAGVVSLIIGLPNVLLAALFAFAACMGG